MADKPMYYGSKSPMYYGGGSAYGAGSYGSPYGGGYGYGKYGAYGYGGSYGGSDESEGSFVGNITFTRVLRVLMQRWLSVFVFLLVGIVVAFSVYTISPIVYQATSEFTLDMRRTSRGNGLGSVDQTMPDYGSTYGEIFNTRISDWRSDRIVNDIVKLYRAAHPASAVADGEIVEALGGSRIELVRNSRLITISVKSRDAKLAAALANAYAEAIERFTDEENRLRCDKAVAQIHANVEKRRHEVDKITQQLLDFRTAHKVDNLRSQRDTVQQGLSKTTGDILALETQETQLAEWEKLLAAVQKAPDTFGNLSSGVPRAQEIATEYRAFQDASGEYQGLLVSYTENHPEVIAKKKALDLAKQRFLDACARALLTGRSTLQVVKNQLAGARTKQEDLRNELASLEQRIVLAESGLGQLEASFAIANDVLKGLILDENQARLMAECNNEIVRVGRPAGVPSSPIAPDPKIIFGIGIAVSLALGVLFVLVMDNLEDTVVNLSDVEDRLALKMLAVLPHVRRKKRDQVAKFAVEDKYSEFAEAVAGLRNLLSSPRYEPLSHCVLVISTQPGEGKTITSCSLAISYAQSGKRTLLVDFDLRRPRMATVWALKLTKETSFSHVLQAGTADATTKPDFAKLVQPTEIDGLSVIASMAPDGVSPSTILGSSLLPSFFEWAKANFEYVIIDSPPYGVVGDVVSLAVLADSSIIMCCPDRTRFRPVQYCSRCLTEAGANILGVIVNDVEVSTAAALAKTGKYGYGYGYGYRPKSGREKNPEDYIPGHDGPVIPGSEPRTPIVARENLKKDASRQEISYDDE